MQDINTLVTFSSRTGDTEKLGLASGLGAVQGRANIRLRWLREEADESALAGDAEWNENRTRMTKEYIGPREIDLLWADVLILAMPARDGASSPEFQKYLMALEALRGRLDGKVVTAFTAEENGGGLVSLCPAFEGLDLILVPPGPGENEAAAQNARLHGRRVTEAARQLKRAAAAQ